MAQEPEDLKTFHALMHVEFRRNTRLGNGALINNQIFKGG
jgi:hypothetical protein